MKLNKITFLIGFAGFNWALAAFAYSVFRESVILVLLWVFLSACWAFMVRLWLEEARLIAREKEMRAAIRRAHQRMVREWQEEFERKMIEGGNPDSGWA